MGDKWADSEACSSILKIPHPLFATPFTRFHGPQEVRERVSNPGLGRKIRDSSPRLLLFNNAARGRCG
jgi:hypothetical protein